MKLLDKKITSEDFSYIMLRILLKDSNVYNLTLKHINLSCGIGTMVKIQYLIWINVKDLMEEELILSYMQKGIIKNCFIEGNFFLSCDTSKIEDAFIDCKYNKEDIIKLLDEFDVYKYFYKITK